MPRGISRVRGVAHKEEKTLNKQTFEPCDQGLVNYLWIFFFGFLGGENPTFSKAFLEKRVVIEN